MQRPRLQRHQRRLHDADVGLALAVEILEHHLVAQPLGGRLVVHLGQPAVTFHGANIALAFGEVCQAVLDARALRRDRCRARAGLALLGLRTQQVGLHRIARGAAPAAYRLGGACFQVAQELAGARDIGPHVLHRKIRVGELGTQVALLELQVEQQLARTLGGLTALRFARKRDVARHTAHAAAQRARAPIGLRQRERRLRLPHFERIALRQKQGLLFAKARMPRWRFSADNLPSAAFNSIVRATNSASAVP